MTSTLGDRVQRGVLALALWVLLGSLACALLAFVGAWTPWVAGAALLALGALAWRLCAGLEVAPLAAGPVLALLAVSAAVAVWAGATHSEQVIVRRDSASYLQASLDLAEHHRRPIAVDVAALGGPETLREEGVVLDSPAFYGIGSAADPAIQPQFVIGPPAWYSAAIWVGGATGALWAAAIFGGLGVLAIGLLAAVLIGPRWGAPAAALVGACFPYLHTIRSTYSEPIASLTLAAGLLALALAARETPRVAAARLGLLAGLLIAGSALVRADALREAILLVPVAALAIGQQRPWGRSLLVGTGIGTLVAAGTGLVTSYRYLGDIAGSLVPLVAGGVAVGLVSGLLIWLGRRGWSLPMGLRRLVPGVLSAAVVVIGLVLASRPLWLVTRQSAEDPGARVVAGLQLRQGLPVDGGRTYAEDTVHWMSWWIGPVALAVALGALAVLTYAACAAWRDERPLPAWSGPGLVAAGSTLLTLARPGITPDHPWADRRLLIALPFALLLVCAAAAALVRGLPRLTGQGGAVPRLSPRVGAALAGLALLATALPVAEATGHHAGERVERGELAAVRSACRQLRPGDVALAVSNRAANEWPQVLRGMCGVPTVSTKGSLRATPAELAATARRIDERLAARGGRLVLVSGDSPEDITRLGPAATPILDVTLREDERLLEQRPDRLADLPLRLWTGTLR
ncbi:hypothetical protein ACQP1U_13460 [Actinomycetota bacterium]